MSDDPTREIIVAQAKQISSANKLIAKISLYAEDAAMGTPEQRLGKIWALIVEHRNEVPR